MENKGFQKTAVVVGGSNGIGLAITLQLLQTGYHVNVLDICPPEQNLLPEGQLPRQFSLI